MDRWPKAAIELLGWRHGDSESKRFACPNVQKIRAGCRQKLASCEILPVLLLVLHTVLVTVPVINTVRGRPCTVVVGQDRSQHSILTKLPRVLSFYRLDNIRTTDMEYL